MLLGDELDSPRGRIYLMKDMLEAGRAADAGRVKHIDRCLSCLACMTTCPSGVHYMHLVDHGRRISRRHYRRPLLDRRCAALLGAGAARARRCSASRSLAAALAKPVARFLPARLRAMLELAPAARPAPSPVDRPQIFPA